MSADRIGPGIRKGLVAVMAAVASLWPAYGLPAEPETLETVLAVWRKREADVKSLKVVIAEDYFLGQAVGLEGEPVERTQKMKCVVIIDGANMRYERVGELFFSRPPEARPFNDVRGDRWSSYQSAVADQTP